MRVSFCLAIIGALITLSGCSSEIPENTVVGVQSEKEATVNKVAKIHPEIWPKQSSPIGRDQNVENTIASIMARMTLEEKVGQIIQGDIASTTPEDVKKYNLGSILNGGNSAPGGDNRTTPDAWLTLADEFWLASTDTSDGGVGIPTMWGTDAVHGHSNILGATLFPHNIGLGAANDPGLMYEIGRATAIEMLVTGMDWTFAPTIAVVRDDRWGRTYESYSEDPAIVRSYAGMLIEGIQGKIGTDSYFDDDHLLATAKHFIGDGGTVGGKDQGDNVSTEEELRDIQGAGYPVAIQHGAQVVMASFNSWHGRKMHGYKELLDDVLVKQMGLDGFVVGDWNGHGQVAGCTNTSCAAAFNNGLDMFMASDSWEALYANTLSQVKSGEISLERLDEAVMRILRVKHRIGLFDAGLPSKRKYAGQYDLLAASAHKAIARKAVRQSLVLLKNKGQLLPLSPKLNVLVAGDAANNIGKQAGGWTLSWQGTGNSNKHFPQGTSIYQGVAQHVSSAGGNAVLSESGEYQTKPDVAMVVFGEEPYAEFNGDRPHLDFQSEKGLNLLKKFKGEGIPTVAVFISGRAMWVNPEINASDAFVAAWLPGSEGSGITDVLFRQIDESIGYDFTGKLSFSWPITATQTAVNIGDQDYSPLFPYGYGLTYSDQRNLDSRLSNLSEDPELGELAQIAGRIFLRAGDPVPPWRLVIREQGGTLQVTNSNAISATGALTLSAQDHLAQEDSSLLVWKDAAALTIEGDPIDLSESLSGMALEVEYSVSGEEVGTTVLSLVCNGSCAGVMDVTEQLKKNLNQGWQLGRISMRCFEDKGMDMQQIGTPIKIESEGLLSLQVSSIKLIDDQESVSCSL